MSNEWTRLADRLASYLVEAEAEIAEIERGPVTLAGQERRAELAALADELAELARHFSDAAKRVARDDTGTVAR
jgi:hypothetical protein